MAVQGERIGDLLARWEDGLARGTFPKGIYNDQSIFDLEMEHIFQRGWQFVGFGAEIPEQGDYVVRPIAGDEYIITRDEDGDVRMLLNSCAHQGTPVCAVEKGNASHFRCRYHGWTYDNSGDLVGVTLQDEAYGEEGVDKEANGLEEIAKHGSYKGILFACPDPDAESLEEFLGDVTWHLDFLTGMSPAGIEVRGPVRHEVDVNWKVAIMNTMGDTYHGPTAHRSAMETGLIGADSQQFGNLSEHKYHVHEGPGCVEYANRPYLSQLPDEMAERTREALDDDQWELLAEREWLLNNGGLYPNVIFTNLAIRIEEGVTAPVTQFRMLRPLGPDRSEAWHWHVIDAAAPDDVKDASMHAFTFYGGATGMITQDDLDIWPRVTGAAGGTSAADTEARVDMKLEQTAEATDFPGPGTVYATKLNEANSRHFLSNCLDAIQRGLDRDAEAGAGQA